MHDWKRVTILHIGKGGLLDVIFVVGFLDPSVFDTTTISHILARLGFFVAVLSAFLSIYHILPLYTSSYLAHINSSLFRWSIDICIWLRFSLEVYQCVFSHLLWLRLCGGCDHCRRAIIVAFFCCGCCCCFFYFLTLCFSLASVLHDPVVSEVASWFWFCCGNHCERSEEAMEAPTVPRTQPCQWSTPGQRVLFLSQFSNHMYIYI